MENYDDKVKCIKDVIMNESGEVVFTKGKIYKANFNSRCIYIINNNRQAHPVGTIFDTDRFFQKHFERVFKYDY